MERAKAAAGGGFSCPRESVRAAAFSRRIGGVVHKDIPRTLRHLVAPPPVIGGESAVDSFGDSSSLRPLRGGRLRKREPTFTLTLAGFATST